MLYGFVARMCVCVCTSGALTRLGAQVCGEASVCACLGYSTASHLSLTESSLLCLPHGLLEKSLFTGKQVCVMLRLISPESAVSKLVFK